MVRSASALKWAAAALSLGLATCLVWLSFRSRAPAPAPAAAPKTTALPSPSASPPRLRELVYDCRAFGVTETPPCAELPSAETEFLEAARIVAVMASGCHHALGPEKRARAQKTLQAALARPVPAGETWRKALLQNAALRLEACSKDAASKPGVAAPARAAGVRAWALSGEELAALPRAEAQLKPWLGEPSKWLRADESPSHIHESSTGATLSYQAITHGEDVANIGRAVLRDDEGQVRVSDFVVRALFRRTTESAVTVCIGELDPSSQACGAERSLRAVPEELAAITVAAGAGPACRACHFDGARRSGPFGPGRGLELSPQAEVRAKAALSSLRGF